MPGGWAGSTRRAGLPPDWPATCVRIKARDQYCMWFENSHRCCGPPDEVDHIVPLHLGGTDEDANLRALCRFHHARKSSAEGNARRWAIRERRPAEPHPGMTTSE